ncbi:cytosine permease [Glaciecola sp. 33A]|uniref:purine-cytosine permease family protein n=1 Tax=Glaciecola sp. 33A TaxID=2057807 RepID=UPI000C332C5A|nr:cytosine permease [Glaciecola sp. 33A]PKI01471.1 purine-cytosine transporter [Glaciecola sp. 33A]
MSQLSSPLNSPLPEYNSVSEKKSEAYGPVKGTLSTGRIAMIWLAANLVVTTLLTGTLFVPGVSWQLALSLIAIGTVIGSIVLVLIGNMGTRTGLATMSLTKGAFGLRGSFFTTIANVVILMGWCWVQAILAGVTVNFLVEQYTGFSNPVLFSVLCQTLVVGLAIFGHEGISKVEPWLAVMILIIMMYIFSVAFTAYSVDEFMFLQTDNALGWNASLVIDVVIATAISWTVLSAEFNRLAKSQKAGIVGSGLGYIASTILSMSLGATAIAYIALQGSEIKSFDPISIVAAFGAPFALVIFLSVMATNTMVVYGMIASVVNITPNKKIKFVPTALVLGVISIIGSSWLAMLDQFTSFLTLVGTLFIPVFAIMIVDYYIIKKSSYHHDILLGYGGRYWYQNGFNIPAIIIWTLGVIVSLILTYSIQSPVGVTIPTFGLSFIAYLICMTLLKKQVKTKEVSVHLG